MRPEPADLETELEALHEASFGWALVCCSWRAEDAQDVLQTAYLKVLDGSARFGGRSALKTWLFGVIRRTAAERRRRHFVRELSFGRWLGRQPAGDVPATPESLASSAESATALRAALGELPRRQREVLCLMFDHDLTVDQAAELMGVSVGSARTHYHRGKAALRRRLGDGCDD